MFTQDELNKLIESVEQELTGLLAKSESGVELAKAESEEKEEKEEPKAEIAPEEAKEEAVEAKEEAPAEAEEAKEEPKAPEAEEAKEEPKEHGYDEEDLKHMEEMYGSMSHSELLAHHDAVKKCLDAKGLEKCGDMQIAKSEDLVSVEASDLLKSELETEKAKNQELQKQFNAVSEFLGKLLTKKAPEAKAITSIETIAKSESVEEQKVLSKSEIDGILLKKSSDPSLSKADRDLINAFYLSNGSINSIAHLLK